MKKEITTSVWCCDICHRQGSFHGTCELCGKEYCYMCEYIGYNPMYIKICSRHQNNQDMKETLEGFRDKIRTLKEEILTGVRNVVICTELEKEK